MTSLMQKMNETAQRLGVPLGVQLDLTYRCNERCVHCYLDHDDRGEMTTSEIRNLLDQLAAAGVFFLTLSGGEILMRRDLFEIMAHARDLSFCIRLKTNAVMIRETEADRIRECAPESVQISIYSHRATVHDTITKLPGSLLRSLNAARLLLDRGIRVIFASVLMRDNFGDYAGVRALAEEFGAQFTLDPTITPMMDGNRSVMSLSLEAAQLEQVLHDPSLTAGLNDFCTAPLEPLAPEVAADTLPCSAGHTYCYISPYGDVFPCVQFPLPTGNVRHTGFVEIWRDSPKMKEVRSITVADLPACSTCAHGGSCTRCPGLAYMDGNMRGPSAQDCEKSYARTGVVTAGMLARRIQPAPALVQIQAARV